MDGEVLPPERYRDRPWLWKPGQSGNPAGEHDAKLKARVLRYARGKGMVAIRKLVELIDDPKATKTVQLMAAMAVLDRGFGKPKQALEVENNGRSLEQLLQEIAEARRLEREENGEGEPRLKIVPHEEEP